MRILQVIESFGAGSMHVALTISERLAAEGHTLAIAHGRVAESPQDARSAVAEEIELFELPWARTPRAQARVGVALRAIVRRWQPDVVHLHSSFAGFIGAAALPSSVPLIYTPHGYSFDRAGQSRLVITGLVIAEHLVGRRVDVVGVVSRAEGRRAAAIRVPRIVVVPNGIAELDDPPGRKPTHAARPVVVSIGRIAPQRQPEAASHILGSLRDLAEVEWIGGGEDAFVALVREQGVTVSGWLTRPEVLERLAGAEACLHWSAWDAQPLAVLEAMARDVVVVASDIPANLELLGERQVCASAAQAGALLRATLTDATVRAELLAEQRRRRVGYSATRMVAQWKEIYRAMAAGAPPPGLAGSGGSGRSARHQRRNGGRR